MGKALSPPPAPPAPTSDLPQVPQSIRVSLGCCKRDQSRESEEEEEEKEEEEEEEEEEGKQSRKEEGEKEKHRTEGFAPPVSRKRPLELRSRLVTSPTLFKLEQVRLEGGQQRGRRGGGQK